VLKREYDHVIIGKSYISLLKGLGELQRGKSVLIVDDERFQLGDKWIYNIGDLEKRLIHFYINSYGVDNAIELDNYLTKTNTMLYLNDKMIELSSSPFANIREFARKLPECFSSEFIDSLSTIDSENFNKEIDLFFNRIIDYSLLRSNTDLLNFFIPENKNIEKIMSTFLSYLDNDSLKNKQLQYILQALFQTFFSNKISEVESRYLLCSILGTRYKVDRISLESQLLFEFKTRGGHIKSTKVINWEFYDQRLEYILLDSYEGLIRANLFSLLGHLNAELPFQYPTKNLLYKSLKLNCNIDHDFTSLFKNKRIVFCESDKIGTDFPHFEVFLKDNDEINVLFSYADHEGTKPKFYFDKASNDVYKSLNQIFPGLLQKDWNSQIQAKPSHNIWLENINTKSTNKQAKLYSDQGRLCTIEGKPVKALYYEGPLRSRYLGIFGYLINVL
tara:strand:- start:54 stop:1391 length:1338 start_codon:yes stop_codon:yes gene_type:complete